MNKQKRPGRSGHNSRQGRRHQHSQFERLTFPHDLKFLRAGRPASSFPAKEFETAVRQMARGLVSCVKIAPGVSEATAVMIARFAMETAWWSDRYPINELMRQAAFDAALRWTRDYFVAKVTDIAGAISERIAEAVSSAEVRPMVEAALVRAYSDGSKNPEQSAYDRALDQAMLAIVVAAEGSLVEAQRPNRQQLFGLVAVQLFLRRYQSAAKRAHVRLLLEEALAGEFGQWVLRLHNVSDAVEAIGFLYDRLNGQGEIAPTRVDKLVKKGLRAVAHVGGFDLSRIEPGPLLEAIEEDSFALHFLAIPDQEPEECSLFEELEARGEERPPYDGLENVVWDLLADSGVNPDFGADDDRTWDNKHGAVALALEAIDN